MTLGEQCCWLIFVVAVVEVAFAVVMLTVG